MPSPSANKTSLGIVKEASYGTETTPTGSWLSATDADLHGTNTFNDRGAMRGSVTRELGATGPYTGTGALTVELDADIAQTVLGLAMGSETVTAHPSNPASVTAVTTTAVAPIAYIGVRTVTPVAITNIVVGKILRINTGAGDQEDVRVLTVVGSTFTARFTRTHLANYTITQTPLVLAYNHVFKTGSPRPSATIQWNRIQDVINFFGNKIGSLQISGSAQAIMLAKIATQYSGEHKVGSAATPIYSSLQPFRFEDTTNFAFINGSASPSGIVSFNLNYNTGLLPAEQTFGQGRFANESNEGITVVNGDAILQFISEDMMEYFWGNPGATGPLSVVTPISVSFFWGGGADYVNEAVQPSIKFDLPACLVTENSTPARQGGVLQQSVKWESYASLPAAADDLTVTLVNSNSALF